MYHRHSSFFQQRKDWALLFALISAQLFSTIRHFLKTPLTDVKADVLMYSHYGWYITQGATPYVDYWDPKPPLVHELSALFAVLSGGDMFVLYVIGVVATGCAAVLTAYFAALIVHERTGDWRAALFTGLGTYTFAGFHLLSAAGYRPKFFGILAGVVGLYLITSGRTFVAGFASAAAAAFWQPAIIFPALVLGISVESDGRREALRVAGGVAAAIVLVVAPFVIWWDFHALIGATVIAPLVSSDGSTVILIIKRIYAAPLYMKYGTFIAILAISGSAHLARTDFRGSWWLVVGTLWFAFQLLFLDFDGPGDLIFWFPFVAIVAGDYFATLDREKARAISATVMCFLLISVLAFGGIGIVFPPADEDGMTVTQSPLYTSSASLLHRHLFNSSPMNPSGSNIQESQYSGPSPREIYWQKNPPDRCFSWINKQSLTYIRQTGSEINQTKCTY